MKKLSLIILVLPLVLFNLASAQWGIDPEGITDSAYISCGKNGWFGSGLSQVTFKLRYYSDNTGDNQIAAMGAILIATGTGIVALDTTLKKAFEGTAVEHFDILSVTKNANPDPSQLPAEFVYGAVSFSEELQAGDSILANVVFYMNDTGTVCIETTSTQTFYNGVSFVTKLAQFYNAHWPGGVCCKVKLHPPGDVNLDKKVDIVDVVAGVGYIFRGRRPESVQAIDVNANCQWTLADILYLANHVFKFGPVPQVGCLP